MKDQVALGLNWFGVFSVIVTVMNWFIPPPKKKPIWGSPSVSRSVVPDSLQPHGLQPTRLLCPGDFPGKDAGLGCRFLFQGIFSTQASDPGLLHFRESLYRLSYKGSPNPSKSEHYCTWRWGFYRGLCVCMRPCHWCMSDSVIPQTVVHQAPLSKGFTKQEYWSGLPFPTPGDLPTQGSNSCLLRLLHCRQILYHLSHQGSIWKR